MKKALIKLCAVFICFSAHTVFSANFDITHWTTKNGVRVYFIPSQARPILDIAVVFAAGSAYDGKHPGVAFLTNNLLNQGTEEWNADQISEQLDNAGAILSSYTHRDLAAIELRTLSTPKQLNLALRIFRAVLSTPTFPEKAYQRTKNQIREMIKEAQQEPAQMAANAFFKALYEKETYGHPVIGTSETLPAITRENVQDFYQHFYVASNAIIAIVGNVSLEQAKIISERIASSLPKGKAPHQLIKIQENKAKTEHIEFPSSQTHILFGQVGVAPNDPDAFPLLVGNFILGGGMTSRLFQTVRAQNGLAYHVSSDFADMKKKGPFYVTLQTQTNQAQKAIALVKQVLTHFIQKGPSQKELSFAQKHLSQSFALKLSSNQAILNSLIDIAFYDRPLNYLETYQQQINAVTIDQIKEAFKKHLQLPHFTLITVGQTQKNNPASNSTRQ